MMHKYYSISKARNNLVQEWEIEAGSENYYSPRSVVKYLLFYIFFSICKEMIRYEKNKSPLLHWAFILKEIANFVEKQF